MNTEWNKWRDKWKNDEGNITDTIRY